MRPAVTVPEPPEVETLRRGLAARITALRITALEVPDRTIFAGRGDAVRRGIAGRQVSRVARRGEVLIWFLREPGDGTEESASLLIHPKMTRRLVLTSGGVTVFAGGPPAPGMLRPMPNRTTRAVFWLGPECRLYHNDARRLGWIGQAGPEPCRTDPFPAVLAPTRWTRISRPPR